MMSNRKNRWLKIALAIALLSITVGCSRNGSNGKGLANLGPAPAVSFQNLQGQTVKLSQYRGRVVLVNFWATWCEPCKMEIPSLIQIQNEYGSKDFTILGVAMDEAGKSAVAPFVAEPQFTVNGKKAAMDYPILLGNDQIATKFGGIIGLPTSYLISKNGQVVKKVIGMIDPHEMEHLIAQLLSSSPGPHGGVKG